MSGPKQPSTVTQTNKIELSPEQKEVFGLAMPKIREYASSTPSLFPGSGIVGFNPTQLAGQQAALQAGQTAGQLANQSGTTQSMLLDPNFMLNPNQYLMPVAQSVARTATENLTENILPQIRSGATSAGGQYSGGSTRQGLAEGRAVQGTSREIADSIAKMFLQNYQSGLSGLQSAVQGTGNVMQQQLFPSAIMQQIGGQEHAMDQAELNEMIQRFYTEQDLPLLQSQQLLGLVSGMPGATGVSTVQGAQPQTGGLQQALGLGLSLIGMMSGMPFLGSMGGLMGGMGGK